MPSSRAAPLLLPSQSGPPRRSAPPRSPPACSRSAAAGSPARSACRTSGVRVRRGRLGEERAERLGRDRIVVGERRHAIDQVAQLAHVARPGRAREHVQRRLRRTAAARLLAAAEVGDQRRDVLAPLGQRRHADREHVQAIEQILAERAGARRAPRDRRGSRRRRAPRSGLRRPSRPGGSTPVSSTRSSLACSGERQLGDLVEEQRPLLAPASGSPPARDRRR